MAKKKPKYRWGKRRQMVDNTIYFCIFCILWILFREKDLEIYETIATNCFLLIGTVISVYVGGRTIETIKNTTLQKEAPPEEEKEIGKE